MKNIFAGLVIVSAFGGGLCAYAPSARAEPSAGGQLDTCRQNVIQLTEKARIEQAALAKLRTERKTLGTSGGEVVRYKLANLDQEIKEHSKQSQSLNAQVEAENKRCDALAAKASGGNRGTQAQPSGRKP